MRYIFITFIILFAACSSSGEESYSPDDLETIHVNIDEAKDTLNMSEFFSGVEYMPLQTPNDRPIGRIRKIMPREEHIALYDQARHSVWIFTHEGKYVNEVEIPEGRGPGEVTNLNDVVVTEEDEIHALGEFKIAVYNLKGEFLEESRFDFRIYKFHYHSPTEEYIGYADNSLNPGLAVEYSGHNLLYFNKEGEITKSFLPIGTGREHMGSQISNRFPGYRNQRLFFQYLVDTVYTVDGSAVNPRYALDYGEYAVPEEVFERRDSYSDLVYEWVDFMRNELEGKYITGLSYFNETDNYLFFRISTREEQFNVIHNKVTDETTVGPAKLTNDIDYGYVPFHYASYDNKLYTVIEANDLLRHLNEVYENEPEKYRSPRMQNLINLANSLPENSNPILQVLNFKINQ